MVINPNGQDIHHFILQWLEEGAIDLVCLGTDGYGLSESRPVLRDYFGISAEHIARAARNS